MKITGKIKGFFTKRKEARRAARRAEKEEERKAEANLTYEEEARIREERVFKAFPDARTELARNAVFKDVGKGKRCFVLGNGPSLRTEDLTRLADEYVITVNQAARHPDFAAMRTNFHFWADPNFFVVDESRPEDLDLLEIMKKVNTEDNKPVCFFPFMQKKFVKKHKLDEVLNVHYFHSSAPIPDDFEGEIDCSRVTPGFHTVVMWGISLAIYMGFEEIYLLGVDTTSILVNIKSFLQQNDSSDYAYDISENEKLRLERMLQRQSLEGQARSFWFTLKQYRNLNNYCSTRGIKLVNCSSSTLIDSVPRMRLVDVLCNKS